ncbi:hypothetical protein AAG570_002401 [Ranatra chinensis]|uniref:Uncharacterized protein n=1 Tax=Ranatra chinensis TaxID=642074 RepID=A0ABD0Y7F7_9HEMI
MVSAVRDSRFLPQGQAIRVKMSESLCRQLGGDLGAVAKRLEDAWNSGVTDGHTVKVGPRGTTECDHFINQIFHMVPNEYVKPLRDSLTKYRVSKPSKCLKPADKEFIRPRATISDLLFLISMKMAKIPGHRRTMGMSLGGNSPAERIPLGKVFPNFLKHKYKFHVVRDRKAMDAILEKEDAVVLKNKRSIEEFLVKYSGMMGNEPHTISKVETKLVSTQIEDDRDRSDSLVPSFDTLEYKRDRVTNGDPLKVVETPEESCPSPVPTDGLSPEFLAQFARYKKWKKTNDDDMVCKDDRCRPFKLVRAKPIRISPPTNVKPERHFVLRNRISSVKRPANA